MAAHRSNRSLLAPYLAPYAAFVVVGSLPGEPLWVHLGRIAATGAALAWAWPHYAPLPGPRRPAASVCIGIGAGLVGTVVWIALAAPFATGARPVPPLPVGVVRMVAATLLVPIFEEQLLRGYVFRLIVQWQWARREGAIDPLGEALDRKDVRDFPPGAWTPTAALVSAALFALGHRPFEWLAGVAYGLLMVGLWARRGDLLACVSAHAATNLALGLYVLSTGSGWIW